MNREALVAALKRFAYSVVETGIAFAAIAVLAAISNPNITAREVAFAAAVAFTKGAVEASARYLAAVKDRTPPTR